MELLHCRAGQQPKPGLLNFWHTLSDCLTILGFQMDWLQSHMRFQPQLLRELRALTYLTLSLGESRAADVLEGDILDLPALKILVVQGYWARKLQLECPKLASLTMDSCDPLGKVSLQASLRTLNVRSSGEFSMHNGFPLTNFLDLVTLKIECECDQEEEFFQSLPLMTKLQTLELGIYKGDLLRSLPQSLRQVGLYFIACECWDSHIIPVLQQLSELRELTIEVSGCVYGSESPASLSCDLRPFMSMRHLHTLTIGMWRAWTPSSLSALAQFEAELIKAGSKLKLIC